MPGKPNGTVIQVIEAGYTLSGRPLRAAKVGIAKNALMVTVPTTSTSSSDSTIKNG